jgi:hypothetical protein
MPTVIRNKTTRADRIRKILAGLTAHFSGTTIVLGGTSYKPAALQAFLQADVAANDASTQAKAAWISAVHTAQSTDSATDIVLTALEQFVRSQFLGTQNEAADLADFGYLPRKRAARTSAQKAASAVQSEATRKARGTVGPKAKSKIKGTVVPAASTEPSAPAVPPAPAAASPSSPASNSSTSTSPSAVATAVPNGAPHA